MCDHERKKDPAGWTVWRQMHPGLLAAVLAAACSTILCVKGDELHRNLLVFRGDDDDDQGFNFDFEGNVSLASNTTKPLCFSHRVDCVEYRFRAKTAVSKENPGPAKSIKILGFVAPKKAADRIEEERRIDGDSLVEGSSCAGVFCDLSDGADTSNKADMCVYLVNADFEFSIDTGLDAFRQSGSEGAFVDIAIEGCPTTSQKIAAIVVPITVFTGVAACFSAWWVRRRRKDRTTAALTAPSCEMPMVAVPSVGQQPIMPQGQMPVMANGYAVPVGAGPGTLYARHPTTGGPYRQSQGYPQDGYPMVFANV